MAGPASAESCLVVGHKPHVEYRGTMKYYNIGRKTGECYAAFHGIPYARIPGQRMKRYQAPLPLLSRLTRSNSTYEANVTDKSCTQSVSRRGRSIYIGSSDCLYLDIFVPEKPELIKELLPVLVFVHGGGFSYGSKANRTHTPDYIIQHGIVFVTINYRVGLFGFLNMRTKDCPGNAGLKDQVKALEWIRDNIECFKGDPNNVTISGSSAGATCVNLHLIAPMSKDLFHKAIVQSGGVYCSWGYRGHRLEQKRFLSKDPQFWTLSSIPEESYELHEYTCPRLGREFLKRHPLTLSPTLGPSVEKFREGAFLPDELEEMMKNVQHDKPVIAGITKAEGILPFIVNPRQDYADIINNDHKFLNFLMSNFRWSDETAGKLIDEIRNKYFPNRSNSNIPEKKLCFQELFRDVFFRRFYDCFKFGPDKTVHKNLYVYRFDHFSEICQASFLKMYPFHDPTHGDELKYLYCPESNKWIHGKFIYKGPNQNEEIQTVMDHICSLWANFCKTGIPKSNYDRNNVEWRRHTEENPCYLSIGTNLELKEAALFQDEWGWLNERVNAQPIVHSVANTPEEEEE